MNLSLKNVHLIDKFEFNTVNEGKKPFEVVELFRGERRRLLKIKLANGEILKKHKAPSPITILCLAGKAIFKTGENLEEEIEINQGDLLTLEAEIFHEIVADPAVKILLTIFT